MKKKKLPKFKTETEEARFWETHSPLDYLTELDEVSDIFVVAPKLAEQIKERARKRIVGIRLAKWEIEKAKQIAKVKKVPYQRLMRQWIDEGLRREFASIH